LLTVFENVFETVNSGFAQALYEDYLRDPSSVPDEWRRLFDNGLKGDAPSESERQATAQPTPTDQSLIQGPALRLLRNMEDSLSIPTATSFRDIEVSALWQARAGLNQSLKPFGTKLSFTHFIGWAIVRSVRDLPAMGNAVVVRDDGPHRIESDSVNLGLAVDVVGRDGNRKLMVPVIKGADAMSFSEFHAEYERLVAGARDGKLLPDAYMGGTITLTNPGTIGTVASVPRLMTGQGSIIATGAIRSSGDSRIMTVTSTYDHRIIQGAESGLFLQTLDRLLQGDSDFYAEIAELMGVPAPGGPYSTLRPVPLAEATSDGIGAGAPVDEEMFTYVAAAMALVGAYRSHGYLTARLDPLGTEPIGDPALEPKYVGLTPDVMAQIPASVLGVCIEEDTLADVVPKLQETYCGTLAYEIEHIASHYQRAWLRCIIESGDHRTLMPTDSKRDLLKQLLSVAGLEEFLHRTYLGQKRFGIEGLEMLVPMLTEAIEIAGSHGTRDVVMGMAHRGRLNVLTHVLGVPYEALLAEFEGGHDTTDTLASASDTGDVKYHYGASGVFETRGKQKLDVILMPNPSHLEAVNPVVEGHVRASQTDRSSSSAKHDTRGVLPILIHGDAAFAGQGVVAETLNLASLNGYNTGGTLHIITNNQIGFTTEPSDARSTDFASDLAKGFDIPIVHVNADDPEACIAAVRLAMMYREEFHGDFVINLVGYRRYGHNEGDEPRYTQPQMYARIDNHQPVASLYGAAITDQGVITENEIEQERNLVNQRLTEALARVKAEQAGPRPRMRPVRDSVTWSALAEPDTRVDRELLQDLNQQLLRVPSGFTINPKLQRLLDRRTKVFTDDGPIDWAHAEALALSSLLSEGVPIRMVGQDTVRGTFSQRHLALYDATSGEQYAPIQHLGSATAPLELYNTPLSEYGALGFEYGYSVAAPETLVLWEAQFGDFANTAEVIIDQFIIGGLAKWAQTSRLVMLLPHGYEGQGPEHSSARLERYLALGVEDNIRVANCSTPAQYFHLLRRQAKHQQLRPLILMTPKSLLRHPQAISRPHVLVAGHFHHVLDDPTLAGPRDNVTRIVLCSGKVYYDAIAAPQRKEAKHVAIGRIEQLYPFPEDAVGELLGGYRNVREIAWLQEEPHNMGARKWIVPQLQSLAPEWATVSAVTRPGRSSPAEGYLKKHLEEQAKLVGRVLGPPVPVRRSH
jgi:2-oxoglutarate dehydrogenase E1 component